MWHYICIYYWILNFWLINIDSLQEIENSHYVFNLQVIHVQPDYDILKFPTRSNYLINAYQLIKLPNNQLQNIQFHFTKYMNSSSVYSSYKTVLSFSQYRKMKLSIDTDLYSYIKYSNNMALHTLSDQRNENACSYYISYILFLRTTIFIFHVVILLNILGLIKLRTSQETTNQ